MKVFIAFLFCLALNSVGFVLGMDHWGGWLSYFGASVLGGVIAAIAAVNFDKYTRQKRDYKKKLHESVRKGMQRPADPLDYEPQFLKRI